MQTQGGQPFGEGCPTLCLYHRRFQRPCSAPCPYRAYHTKTPVPTNHAAGAPLQPPTRSTPARRGSRATPSTPSSTLSTLHRRMYPRDHFLGRQRAVRNRAATRPALPRRVMYQYQLDRPLPQGDQAHPLDDLHSHSFFIAVGQRQQQPLPAGTPVPMSNLGFGLGKAEPILCGYPWSLGQRPDPVGIGT